MADETPHGVTRQRTPEERERFIAAHAQRALRQATENALMRNIENAFLNDDPPEKIQAEARKFAEWKEEHTLRWMPFPMLDIDRLVPPPLVAPSPADRSLPWYLRLALWVRG